MHSEHSVVNGGAGVWGGACRCPDGQVFQVGDNADYCQSLACRGGTSGQCMRDTTGPWVVRKNGMLSGRKVECATQAPLMSLAVKGAGRELGVLHPAATGSRGGTWRRDHADTDLVWLRLDAFKLCLQEHTKWIQEPLCFELNVEHTIDPAASRPVSACSSHPPILWADGLSEFRLDIGPHQLSATIVSLYPPSPPQAPHPPFPPPRPPSPRPRSPPPVGTQLSSRTCDALFASPDSLFHRMWAVEARKQNKPGERTCWDVARDVWSQPQPSSTFFHDIEAGTYCDTDWYAESQRNRGHFRGPEAPALLGLDSFIVRYCGGTGDCDNANANILQLRPLSHAWANGQVEWNMCRNFEWQMCAARGRLHLQRSGKMIFAYEPNKLWLDGSHGSPKFGSCSGYHQSRCRPQSDYANDDVYFLEVCIFNKICRNGDQLFHLSQYEPFFCDYSSESFSQLQSLLVEGPRH